MPSSPRTLGLHRRALASTILCALCLLAPRCSQADESTTLLPLLREQRREADEQERAQRLRQLTVPAAISAPATPTETPRAGPCWAISGVRLAGNTRIAAETLNRVLEPLLQPCMDEARINALLKAITRAYLERGYLASRPYLANPPEPGASLDIVIVEGFVESVEFDDPQLPLSLSRAFPDLVGLPLTLAALEQGLKQMNRLQAFDLGADLQPGELHGGTRVVIRSQRPATSRWQLGARRESLVGSQQAADSLALRLSLDSPLENNDFLNLYSLRGRSAKASEQTVHSLGYNIPHGPWLFTLGVTRAESVTFLPGSRGTNNGHSDFYSLTLDRGLWSGHSAALNASLRLNYKRLDNRFSNQWLRLRLQSPTLATLEARLHLTWHDDALWGASLGYSRGLGWFGADDQAPASNAPQPLFDKYQASLWQLRQGRDPALRWRWESELSLQYSPVPLAAVEQMAIADDTAVRGFRQATVSGASGAVWRNTLSLPLEHPLPRTLEIRPSLGLDAGWSRHDHGSPSQGLLGAHAGLQLSLHAGHLRLGYQRALHASGMRRQDLEPGYWRAELNLTF